MAKHHSRIPPEDYTLLDPSERRRLRQAYVEEQKGLCFYCKAPLNEEPAQAIKDKPVPKERFPVGFFDWPVHLHHCHKTGMTEGAVHNYCNAVLWIYENR
jgi:hypothetical protein